jgi:tetratricopeptide (TPR) repeat protein
MLSRLSLRHSARHLAASCFLAIAALASAQTVRWDPPGGQLGYNQISEIALVFENCEPKGAVGLPRVDGLTFGRPSQSTETSMVNFNVTRRFSYVYPVRAERRATLTIPAFDVSTDQGTKRVEAATFTVGDATVGSSGVAVNDIAQTTLTVPKNTFWVGEVFPVTYTMSVVRRYFHSPGTLVEWQPAPLVAEDWSKPEPSEPMIRGERRIVATQTTRAYAKQPGTVTTKPASQVVNLVVGQTGFGLFSTPSVEQRILETEPLNLTIKPLPAAPPEFSGAVGKFTLSSKIVPTTPGVGEPVTWTLEFSGTGNWPDISGLPQREVSNDFSVVQPKSKRTMKENSLFEGTLVEDVVLVPTKPGKYTLGPIRLTYFDTETGSYRTLASEPVTITVGPAAAPTTQPAPSGPIQFNLDPGKATPSQPELPAAVAPAPPENLPRDPIAGTDPQLAPRRISTVAITCTLVALAIPLVIWLWLAAHRSRVLDPEKRRRESQAELSRVLAELRSTSLPPDRLRALLQTWQGHAAALWRIPHAAPGTPLVENTVAVSTKDAAPAWATLWSEADRALHGREAVLPSDWTLRAEAALRAVRVPGWSPASLFAPRHLLPFLALALAAFAPAVSRGQPIENYRAGKFQAAEKAWRESVARNPNDWAARHNLGLALAQQDKWGEAAAQWTSSFLLDSRNEIARWDLALGLQRSGLAPPELVEFSRGEGRYGLARMASPGEWQAALVVAAALIALVFSLVLLRSYGRAGSWARTTAIAALVVAVPLACCATLSLHTYGQLADPSVVMVWRESTLRSIPTDADTQKASALSAGSLARADRTFLGWTRLQFAGGQTGWVRTGDIVKLYR